MRGMSLFCVLAILCNTLSAQYVYTIKADSVKLTNCDSSELIIENHTQTVNGFLFNTNNGRTIFKRGAQKLNDSLYLIGADTLKVKTNAWVQGGNSFGNTGILGTLDNNHLDLYTDNTRWARLTNTGNLLLGTTTDAGYKMQMLGAAGTGGLFFQPNLSVPNDRIRFGGAWNTLDGQEALISLSTDAGLTYSQVLSARGGNIGIGPNAGWVIPGTLRVRADGAVSVFSQQFYFGSYGGPNNASSLLTSVSNTNEWITGLGTYPSGQYFYSFGTILQTPGPGVKRAPLHIGADQLLFMTGPINDSEAGRFTEGGALLLGSPTDDGVHILQVNGGILTTKDAVINDSARLNTVRTGTFADSVLVINALTHAIHKIAQSSLAFNGVLNSALAVNGLITAQKLTLSVHDWPDYVFDSAYRLLPLPNLEKYIQQNSHLPGMPAASVVEKKGTDVGETQTALLKKIEELTLYTIEQNKKLESQKSDIKALNNRLEDLKLSMNALERLISNKQENQK